MKRLPNNLSLCLATVLLACFAVSVSAQRTPPSLEQLPQRAVDTIATADPYTKVVLYSNNTWSYYRPEIAEAFDLPVYAEHWDTTQVFSYKSISLAQLSPEIELNLFSSLSEFHFPIKGKVYSKYGSRGRRNHNGIDIPLTIGEPIYATFDGKVRYSQFNTGGFGNLVIVRHKNGLETWYAHLSRLNVKPNDYVTAGQVIGFGGNTGRSAGPHLHFETRYYDQTFDPERLIDFETGQIKYQTFILDKAYFSIYSRDSDQLEDHDFDDLGLLVNESGEPVTATEVLAYLENTQQSSQATVQPSSAVYHTIKSGDILGRIARQYGTTVDNICRLNNISRDATLRIGRTLRVK